MPQPPSPSQLVLEVTGLERLSLQGLDLAVRPGERVAVIGESGAGKSVLLGCILGLQRPARGQIRVLGRPVRGRPVAQRGLGVAFQSPGLIDALPVGRNLTLATPGFPASELRRWLDAVGLDEVALDASAGCLSGGQQKRVALLRALLRGKDLVILDEPTSGLDPASTDLVARLARQHLDQHAGALLMVTHDYAFALALCDRFLLLSDGHLIDVTPQPGTPRAQGAAALQAELAAHPGAAVPVGGEALTATWGFGRLLARYLWEGAPLVCGAMALVGAMLVAQTARSGPLDISRYVPGIAVAGVFREFAPLVAGFLLAARIGTRIAAQVAGMSYTAQLDSMRVLGISPLRMLLLPYAAAAALVFPTCVLAGGLVAVLTGAAVAEAPWLGISIGARRFLDLAADAFEPSLAQACLLKGALTGLAVAVIGYRSGSRPIKSAPLLGSAVTGATVGSAIAVVLIDVVVSWIYFAGGRE